MTFGSNNAKTIIEVFKQKDIAADILKLKKIAEVKDFSYTNGSFNEAFEILHRIKNPLLDAQIPEELNNVYFTAQEADRVNYFTRHNFTVPAVSEHTEKGFIAKLIKNLLEVNFEYLDSSLQGNEIYFYNYLPKVVDNINALQKIFKIEDDATVELVGAHIKQVGNLN